MFHYGSVTRIAGLADEEFMVEPQPRAEWRTGDYVVGTVLAEASRAYTLEWPDGRMEEVVPGTRWSARSAAATLPWSWSATGRRSAPTSG
jgi:hypothetical protein